MLNIDHEQVQLMALLTILLISITLINNTDRLLTHSTAPPNVQSTNESTQSSQSTQSLQSTDVPYDISNHGYGKQYRCSDLQKDWQLTHPFFLAIKSKSTLASFVASLNIPLAFAQLMDFSLILPTPLHLLPRFPKLPQLRDYCQLPFKLWVPEWYFPDLVSHMPCPHNINGSPCHHVTKRHRWRSGGPRVVHGLNHSMYIHTWDYTCPHHRDFSGFNPQSISRLPPIVRDSFEYVFDSQDGVTLELHSLIEQARMSCTSFTSLRKRLIENRHNKMYQHIKSYNDHCLHYLHQSQARRAFVSSINGDHNNQVAGDIVFECLEPIIENKNGYYDSLPPVEATLSKVWIKWCDIQEPIHRLYAAQHTADEICVDSSGKAASKINCDDKKKLYSISNLRTGVLLHQQMLSSESHDSIRPMHSQYVARCSELNKPLPTRIVSDRGLTDSNLFHEMFPEAHINTDKYHFIQLFFATLNKSSPLIKDVKSAFSCALYVPGLIKDGKTLNSHAEPSLIIERVDSLIDFYSQGENPCITEQTKVWWAAQLPAITQNRVLSNPPNSGLLLTVSCGALENFHRQLNRLTRGLRFTEDMMRAFLSQLMYQWNIDREREAGLIHNWYSYNHSLLSICYESSCLLYGETKANEIWKGGFRFVNVKAHAVYGIARVTTVSHVQSIPSITSIDPSFVQFTSDMSIEQNENENVDVTVLPSVDEQNTELAQQQSGYQHVGLKTTSFTKYENEKLMNIVAVSPMISRKGQIDWEKVVRDWKSLWLAEVNADPPVPDHVLPRLKSVLEQRYNSIITTQRRRKAAAVTKKTHQSNSIISHVTSTTSATFSESESKSNQSLIASSISTNSDDSKEIATSTHWSAAEDAAYEKIMKDDSDDNKIPYEDFVAEWPFSIVPDKQRFYNKRRSVKRKLESKIKTDPNKKSKGK